MEIKTYTDLQNYLLSVMDFADDTPTKGNPCITKHKYWDMLMSACMGNENKPVPDIILNNVKREFPEYLIDG